jgi:hypothetical protein
MQVDLHARLLRTVRMGNGEITLTFQVKDPSMRYSVGETYTIGE